MRYIFWQCVPLIILATSACAEERLCDDFPSKLSEAEVLGPEIKRLASIDEDMNQTILDIRSCYPDMEYAKGQKSLTLRGAYKADDGEVYLLFEIDGILDDWLAYKISTTGKVTSAFPYSPLSGLYVPDTIGK